MLSRDDLQRRLLDAAGQTFAAKGFEGATVREICRLAGLNIAAVNYYFRDKERLYIEAVKHAACGSEGQPRLPEWQSDTPPAVKLRDFIQMLLNRLLDEERPAWHTQLIMRELARPTAACTEWVEQYVRPMVTVLEGILQEVLPQLAPWQRMMVGFSIVSQCIFYKQNRAVVDLLLSAEGRAEIDAAAVTEHVTRFSLAALGLAAPFGTV
jgi:AcrR family transcriptional regulator